MTRNNNRHIWDDEEFVKEMDKRIEELESGKVKGYTWDEVKEMSRKALSEVRKQRPDNNSNS